MLVDAAATALCLDPCQFDVMVMENMFGDILSDQAGGIGSLGLMPSACVGEKKSYFEPSRLCTRYCRKKYRESLLYDWFSSYDVRDVHELSN